MRLSKMMRWTQCAAAAYALALGSQAVAQPMPDIATDQELLAGYCLGVGMKSKAHQLKAGDASLDAAIARAEDEYIEHFREYLGARGLFNGSRSTAAINGILLARKRGERDALICDARTAVCINKCDVPPDRDRLIECINECYMLDQSCISTSRCNSARRALPF